MRRMATLVALAAACGTAAGAEDLAQRLPAETIVYARVDVRRTLELLDALTTLADAEAGERVQFAAKRLHNVVKQALAAIEFTPAWLDAPQRTRVHFALHALDEPEITTHTYEVAKWDRETGKRVPGEFEERSHTTRREYTWVVAVETANPELAANLFAQVRALAERRAEKDPGRGPEVRAVDVDEGEMMTVKQGRDKFHLGRHGRFVTFSEHQPRAFWRSLIAPAMPSLADSGLYRRYVGGDKDPVGVVFVNTGELFRRLEAGLRGRVAEWEEKVGDAAVDPPALNPDHWQLRSARSGLQMFETVKRIFSLDQILEVGAAAYVEANERRVKSRSRLGIRLGEQISPVLRGLLDGGHRFEPPAIGEWDGLAMMVRVGVAEIAEGVLETLDARQRVQIDQMRQLGQQMIGADPLAILRQFAGDVYLLVNVDRKERRGNAPEPDVVFLLGLRDPEAFREMVAQVMARLANIPAAANAVRKRTFLETDVYVIGPNAARPDFEPDGQSSVAACIAGRHLGIGSWEHVTGLIRRSQAAPAGDRLSDIAAKHRNAGLLLVVPKAFSEKVQKFGGNDIRKDLEILEKEIRRLTAEDLGLPLDDPQLAEELATALREFALAVLPIVPRLTEMEPDVTVLDGSLKENMYEIRGDSELKK